MRHFSRKKENNLRRDSSIFGSSNNWEIIPRIRIAKPVHSLFILIKSEKCIQFESPCVVFMHFGINLGSIRIWLRTKENLFSYR